jgi:hypothetical protein
MSKLTDLLNSPLNEVLNQTTKLDINVLRLKLVSMNTSNKVKHMVQFDRDTCIFLVSLIDYSPLDVLGSECTIGRTYVSN